MNEKMEVINDEISLVAEIKKQQDIICNALCISEKVLQVLRGNLPKNDGECMKDECVFDTLKINEVNLLTLERNLNEIARKVIG